MGTGQELWKKAKQLIPGGNQLLSKRSEMFLPEGWPAYFDRAKGVDVWDLDGNQLIDMSIMGIGTCILGYANDAVNDAVKKAIDQGSMCSLNCPEEVELAEKLISFHPWASMARFSRSGGEACSMAIRIARAYAGKERIAFCGYHGWHDWYLSSNIERGDNLNQQLLSGLKPVGVPEALAGTAQPFHYGKIDELKAIVEGSENKLGVIIMEVQRYTEVDVEFLKAVRQIADEIGAVLIFDEVTSGFRECIGGLHTLYGVNPDMAIFGKALGNGYPISAIIGKEDIMQAAQDTFISSTFWTERIGFTAALSVIQQMQEHNVSAHITEIGQMIKQGWREIIDKTGLNIDIAGSDATPIMMIKEDDALELKTAITQEMLKKGYLASNLVFVSLAHTKEIVQEYLKHLDAVLTQLSQAKQEGSLKNILQGPVCHSGFSRLN